jgi:ribosomal protein L24E
MKKIFFALFFTFVTLEAKSQEYNIIEKTDDFIIILQPGDEMSFHPHLAVPPNFTSFRKTTDSLGKTFNIATEHCSAQDKSAYIFFRLKQNKGDIFIKPYHFRVFDEDSSNTTGNLLGIKIGTKVRFFCAEDKNKAVDLYKKYNDIQWTKFYSQSAAKRHEDSELRFEVRETQEVKKRQLEKEVAKRQEVERLKQVAALEEKRKIDEKNQPLKQIKLIELEKVYGNRCSNKKSNIANYNSCLLEQETKALLEAKEKSIKIANMTADDRRSYTCFEKFGFRKGSDKFKDCTFKIYQAEVELEKLEL